MRTTIDLDAIDWNSIEGALTNSFQANLDDVIQSGIISLEKITVLSKDLVRYLALAAQGDESAEQEKRHIIATITLIAAREEIHVRRRIQSVLLGVLDVGFSIVLQLLRSGLPTQSGGGGGLA